VRAHAPQPADAINHTGRAECAHHGRKLHQVELLDAVLGRLGQVRACKAVQCKAGTGRVALRGGSLGRGLLEMRADWLRTVRLCMIGVQIREERERRVRLNEKDEERESTGLQP